ncbi:hypothetical protein BCEN4_1480008 [Burkholderia cenocepacia]|nr:hypothetical protein BCEN4_1480008 [Burkholderia cenocepacia]
MSQQTVIEVHSQFMFDCRPERVRPACGRCSSGSASKPGRCRVLDGVSAVRNTRQCTTDRGTFHQWILMLYGN